MTMALTVSAARKRPPRYSPFPIGEVKSSGSISAAKSRTAASPKIAAVTSMPSSPAMAVPPAIRTGAFAYALPSAVARKVQIAMRKRNPAYDHVATLRSRYSSS
jgi:hypothetical protein